MSKIAEKKQQIEEIRREIYSFMDDKRTLKKEVTELKSKVEAFEKDYENLILNGKQDEADQLYIDNKSLREEYDLKNKRLMTMQKMNSDKVVLEKWKKIESIANTLPQEYHQEHSEVVKEYIEAMKNVDKVINKMQNISKEFKTYNYGLSVEGSSHLHEVGHGSTLFYIVSPTLFSEDYLKSIMEK